MDPVSTAETLLVCGADGMLLATHRIKSKTISISGNADSDVVVPALGPVVIFLRLNSRGASILPSDGAVRDGAGTLEFGAPAQISGLTLILLRHDSDRSIGAGDNSQPGMPAASLLQKTVRWACAPTPTPADLRNSLKTFLGIVVKDSGASNGFIVLCGEGGFDLVSSYGMTPKDSQLLWDKMPGSIISELLRDKARVLLPDELRQRDSGDTTTVFVKGIKSVAGFPALTEDRVYAIFYLGFENLLTGLTPELQHTLEHCADVLGNVVQRAAMREQLESLRVRGLSRDPNFLPANRLMAGNSGKLSEVYKYISRLAPVDIPVLISGETGTGKELVAQELHRSGTRSGGPFIVVNAAALPETLIESELFGHKKGSFTGALADKVGLIERSAGGTLFIDEIGELPFPLQAKLLRVLQEKTVTRIGDMVQRAVNFRLITATHRNVEEMVKAGTFREDLYYRIAGATVKTWPLRERIDDIAILANYFRKQFFEQNTIPEKEFSSDAVVAMELYTWPGNIRELQNIVSRACIMAEGPVIRREDLTLDPQLLSSPSEKHLDSLDAARDNWMRSYITAALRLHAGKRSDTARALGIGERTLFRYLEQLNINV
jgi:two-component system NtrC family response regulator